MEPQTMLLRIVDSEYFSTHRRSLLVWFTECDYNSENQSTSTISMAGDISKIIVFDRLHRYFYRLLIYVLVAVGSSRILKAKQKLGVTFNSDNQDVIDFIKILKMTMCRASEANSEK